MYPAHLIYLSANGEVHLPLQINLAWLGIPLTGSNFEHSAINGRDIDVEVAAICSNRVKGESVELLEVLLLQDDETLTVPQALWVVILAAGLLRDCCEERRDDF
jgi:hypothetical protein